VLRVKFADPSSAAGSMRATLGAVVDHAGAVAASHLATDGTRIGTIGLLKRPKRASGFQPPKPLRKSAAPACPKLLGPSHLAANRNVTNWIVPR
jgi:hypothetical protein